MQNTMLDSTISNSLQLFENTNWKVRVVMRDGEPWFVAKDVCECLDLGNPSQAIARLEDDERWLISNEALRSNGDTAVVSEPGLYSLVLGSRKPEAKAFKRWVTHEVLPSIRKTGGYGIRTVDDMINDPDTAIRLLTQLKILRLQNDQLAMERDEAIRTKCHFVEGRDAKVCGELGGLRTQNEALRKQIGDSKTYKAATAISWLPDYFDMSNRGLYGSLAAKLKKLEAEMPPAFAHIDIQDSRWGKVKAYHVDVIERLHEMVQADENLMKKYRKIASV